MVQTMMYANRIPVLVSFYGSLFLFAQNLLQTLFFENFFLYVSIMFKLLFFFCIFAEKLLTSEGRDLRRSLFSLKQIFQGDKDLVHGFVGLGGLNCLVRVGNDADQNYQNYILRALGQV